MSIKLIATDLDGTLLNSDRLVSERTLRTLAAARQKGVHITVATGRMLNSAQYFGGLVGADAPLICCNGGLVQAARSDVPLFERTLSDELAAQIITMCHEHGWYVQWYSGQSIYAEHYDPKFFAAYTTLPDFHVIEVGDKFLGCIHNVIQCVVRDLDGNIPRIAAALEKKFGNRIALQQNTGTSTDVTAPEVNKALGLKALSDYLHLAPEEIMACGDSDNDVSMLEYAGTSVVPANGLPMAKERASFLAPSHDADGIAVAIEKLVL